MKRHLCIIGLLFFFGGSFYQANATAHPLAPALLEMKAVKDSTTYNVLWRLSAIQNPAASPTPLLPGHCQATSPIRHIAEPGAAVASRWQVNCGARGLLGSEIRIDKLASSGINVILRIEDRQGRSSQTLLDGSQPSLLIQPPAAALTVLQRYIGLGMQHLAFGPDHLLFLLGLLLLVHPTRARILTLTAFTLGHSVTLSLAVLDIIRVNPGLMELGIALSLVVLARELLRDRPAERIRRPVFMASGFGLLHGLGFASALGNVGLPQTEVVSALLGFNLGIELAQILILCCVTLLTACVSRLRYKGPQIFNKQVNKLAISAYTIGSLAILWTLERLTLLLHNLNSLS